MKKIRALVFPTFLIVSHFDDIIKKIIEIKESSPQDSDFSVVLENTNVYDFDYFGYNIRNDYEKIIERLRSENIPFFEIDNRTLYSYAFQECRVNSIYLIGITVPQLRSLFQELVTAYRSNIIEAIVLDYNTLTLKVYDEYHLNYNSNSKLITVQRPSDEDIVSLCGIDLKNYDIEDHITSILLFPKNGKKHMYKILKGNYPQSWTAKIKSMKVIATFCEKHKIPNCFPTIYNKDNIIILRMNYLSGISISEMIGFRGLQENLVLKENQERKPIVGYMTQICQAINFYHFLGLYVSDIKEDNFFYFPKGVVPIDLDGFSLDAYPSSQPKTEYRGKRPIEDCSIYFHTSQAETYALSFLLFKILFNKKQPIYFDDEYRSIDTWLTRDKNWYDKNRENRKERFSKENIDSWNALPEYLQCVFENLFTASFRTVECFESDEWLLLLKLYFEDLGKNGAVLDYRNASNTRFRNSSKYDFETINNNEVQEDIIQLLRRRNRLLLVNCITAVAVIILIIYINLL